MTAFHELLKTRRSIRDFEDKEVPVAMIREILRETCLAPSSGNGQPWKFIVVADRDWIKKCSDESKNNLLSHIEGNPDSPLKRYEAALRNPDFNVFYNAPALVYIVGSKQARHLYVDCTLAACYFMFSAAARGLGTCWVGLGSSISDPNLLDLMGMPENHEIVAPLILGYPRGIPNAAERNEPRVLKILT